MSALLAGLSLGLAAGISPGPLLTLVITRSLARGFGAGLRIAVAPFLSDAPIILLSTLLFTALPLWLEIALTAAGGCYVIYLGIETMISARHARLEIQPTGEQDANRDLWHGTLVNLLSPHPWLFWISVGSPTLLRAWQVGPWQAIAFLVGFYGTLVGGKIAVAFGVAGGRRYLTDVWYARLLVASGLLLCVFGAILLWSLVPRVWPA